MEVALLDTLLRPVGPGETSATGNARREIELRALIDQLTVQEAFTLGQRLDAPDRDDRLGTAFKRLLVERRGRLRAYIAGARRRAALAAT